MSRFFPSWQLILTENLTSYKRGNVVRGEGGGGGGGAGKRCGKRDREKIKSMPVSPRKQIVN